MIKKRLLDFLTDRKIIFIIIFLSVLVRLLYLSVPFVINVADGAGYVSMADLALEGNWQSFFDDFTYRTPLYPFFIALTKIIFGKGFVWGLPLIQHLLGVIQAVLLFLIGKKVFNKWVGALAGLLTGISAYPIYWEHNSMSDFFFGFVTVLSTYLLLRALTENKKNLYFIFGTAYGINLLVRPVLQLFFVVFPLLIYLFDRDIKSVARKFVWVMIPTLVIIAPWFYQNQTRHHYFGFTPFLGVQLMVRTQNYMDMESTLRPKEKQIYRQAMFEVAQCTEQTIKDGTCGQSAVAGWADLQRKLKYSPTQANQALQEIALEAVKKNFNRYFRETFLQTKILFTNNNTPRFEQAFFANIDYEKSFREQYLQKIREGDFWAKFRQQWLWNLTWKMPIFLILAFIGMLSAILRKNFRSLIFSLVLIYLLMITSAVEEGVVTRYRIPMDPYIFLFAVYGLFSFSNIIKTINQRYEEGLDKK